MSDLVEFLRARLDEDYDHFRAEYGPRMVTEVEVKRRIIDAHEGEHYCPDLDGGSTYYNYLEGWTEERDHPQLCPVVRLLAVPYNAHPDYRAEWKP